MRPVIALSTSTKTIYAPWLLKLIWRDLLALAICILLDAIEYILPLMLSPLFGDIWDVLGVVYCIASFGTIGAISMLELIPGLDIIPFYTITWLIWYLNRQEARKNWINSELERWR
jgi:hypothetical protein